MVKVRAKFECTKVEDCPQNEGKQFEFFPVIKDNCEENKSFAKYTPAGQILIFINYETPACNAFQVGKEYYIDFTEADN